MITVNGRQYNDVAASKAAKQLRDQIQDAHKLIMTFDPDAEGVDLATYAKKITDAMVIQVKAYLSEPFISERRMAERRGFVAEVVSD